MNNQTIADIYANNDKVREKLKQAVSDLSGEQANFLPEGEKWTAAAWVEHIALVETGMTRICAKLLREAENAGGKSSGQVILTEGFITRAAAARSRKLEAPDAMQPTGKQTIAESLAKMDENRRALEELQPLFETVECADYKFPHPFMGDLSAHEWLTLIGGHESRHLPKIENIVAQSK